MQDKPRVNEELRRCEEALPRLKEGDLEKASRMYKAKTGVGCDLTKETRGAIVEFFEKVEQSGRWPQQACTTMFFLIPKNVTSVRPMALMPTWIHLWEALRAPEVAKWQQRYRVDWDATDGRNGGAHQIAWEILMEMESFTGKAKEEDQGASQLSGPGQHTSASQGRSCECFAVIASTSGGYSSKGVRQSATDHHGILPGSKWSCLLCAHCVAGCSE